MPDPRELSCRCGTMAWRVAPRSPGTLVICHCKDCQTAAQVLDAGAALDAAGGTTLFQTLPDRVQITRGAEHLALLRLSPKGLLRWHAGCCGTAIANTLPRPLLPFVGVVLPADETRFGKVRARVFTQSARYRLREHGAGMAGAAIMLRALSALIQGRRANLFFDKAGQPICPARILTPQERSSATR
ncbi:DUF6151 family protein [Salipiger sp. 1_MG-2023]|uniref:DUF6151 family protein n=1 Tax=Salipiger sp. 1_MG-2023 TaxID=3062665 RepID=UPI0026E1BFAC|nr:DUF6151 family protein [Salipiger sp. 1_MG-2023]MDO6587630.1 DUF6151 family protein [Salipiger sp. 1_MG-2023]